MSRYRPIVLTHKNPISVDPSIPNSLESIRFAPISVEPPHTPPSHPPPTIALPLYTLTPEPTPITTLAAPTAPPSRTNHSMIDAPYRRARTLLRPLTFLTYQLDPRPPFCDTTTFSHPLRPTLMTYARRTHSQTLNFTLSYHLYISPTTRDQQPSPDYARSHAISHYQSYRTLTPNPSISPPPYSSTPTPILIRFHPSTSMFTFSNYPPHLPPFHLIHLLYHLNPHPSPIPPCDLARPRATSPNLVSSITPTYR